MEEAKLENWKRGIVREARGVVDGGPRFLWESKIA